MPSKTTLCRQYWSTGVLTPDVAACREPSRCKLAVISWKNGWFVTLPGKLRTQISWWLNGLAHSAD